MVLLNRMDVSVLYPVAVSCSMLAVALISWLFIGEPMSFGKAVGIVLVIAGISVLIRGG